MWHRSGVGGGGGNTPLLHPQDPHPPDTLPHPLAFLRPILKRRLSFSYLVDFKFLYLGERRCVSPPSRLSASAIKIHAHSLPRPRPRRRAQLRPLGRPRRRWRSCTFLIKCGRHSVGEASVNTIKGAGGHELKMAGDALDPADVPDDHESSPPLSFIATRVSKQHEGKKNRQKQWQCCKGVWRPAGGAAARMGRGIYVFTD